MQKKYLWEQSGWPYLTWDNKELSPLLGKVRNRQGQLAGKISLLGDDLKKKTLIDTTVSEILSSARIEGVTLDDEQVLITTGQFITRKRIQLAETDDISVGAAKVSVDALCNYNQQITEERVFLWKYMLEGQIGINTLPKKWEKTDFNLSLLENTVTERKMEHLKIPIPTDISEEMHGLIVWLNTIHSTDPVIKAGVAYLRFLLIRPFEKNNGRIARNITNIFLSRADNSTERFYSISSQIEREIQQYYTILKTVMIGGLDITEWLQWFLYNIEKALDSAEATLLHVMNRSRFFEKCRMMSFNDRQIKMLNMLWDGLDNRKLTTSFWAESNNCSNDTALRDIQDLIAKDILRRESAGGRSTSYCLTEEKKR